MNWKNKFKKHFIQQMLLPVLLVCLLGAVPASGTFCLFNNNTSALTSTFDTYQAPYLVTYKPNGGYWVDGSDNILVKDATETKYGHPTNTYTFNLLQQGQTANVTFDGTSNNPKECTLVYKGYELAGWSTIPKDPMTRSALAEFKRTSPNSFFETTVNLPAWSIKQDSTPQELYAVWVVDSYTMVNGIGINNALRGNLSEEKTNESTGEAYYLPASTTSLKVAGQANSSGRDSTVTHIIFSVGTQTGAITLPTSTGLNGHTVSNVTEADIKNQGYIPTYIDANQQGYIRLYRVYHDATSNAVVSASSKTNVCVAYIFASDILGVKGNPDQIRANENCSYMFYGLTGLLKIGGIINKVDFSTTKSMANMYAVCTSLRWQDAANAEKSNVARVNVSFAWCNVQSLQGMFMGCTSINTISFVESNNYYVTGEDGTKYYGTTLGKLTDMSHMFEGCTSLEKVYFKDPPTNEPVQGDYLDTSHVTNFNGMFLGCKSLTTVDLKYLEVSSACVTLADMFNGCTALTNPVLSNANVDTSGVKSFKGMYSGCEAVSSLNLANITISENAKNLSYMFAGCTKLASITFGNVDSKNVTDFSYMFMGCSAFTSFSQSGDGTGFAVLDTQNATTFEGMFMGCTKLATANVGNWNVSKVENFSSMFANCTSLTVVDSGSWEMGSGSQAGGIDISHAFMGCSNLTTVYVSDIFENTVGNSKIVNSDMLFFGCISLRGNMATDENGQHIYTKYNDVVGKVEETNGNWIKNYGLTADSMMLFSKKDITVPEPTPEP